MSINKLNLLYGDPVQLFNGYKLKHPTLRDIVELNTEDENKYDEYVSYLITTSLDIADILWAEQKIWYEDIKSEWIFFVERSLDLERYVLLCRTLDNGKITMPQKGYFIDKNIRNALNFFIGVEGDLAVYVDNEQYFIVKIHPYKYEMYTFTTEDIVFTESSYMICQQSLKLFNRIEGKNDDIVHGASKIVKKTMLKYAYMNRMDDMKRKRSPDVTLDSIVSALIARGISYKEIWDFPIYTIYDQYYRQMHFDQWNSTMAALAAGNIDTKKNPIRWDKINWSRVIK